MMGTLAPSVGELANRTLKRHFARMVETEPGTRSGLNPEDLHDMRVSVRRLRATISLFRDALDPEWQTLRLELGELGRSLGAVRDLDVQIGHLDEISGPDEPGYEALRAVLTQRREAARREMLRTLDGEDYRTLVERLNDRLCRFDPENDPTVSAWLAMPALIRKRHRKFRRLSGELSESSSPELFHEARIRGKRLRYAVEATVDLYGEAATRFARVLVRFQDLLGLHQDAYVACSLLRDVAHHELREDVDAILYLGALAERWMEKARCLRSDFLERREKLEGKAWKRLEAVMDEGFAAVPPEPAEPLLPLPAEPSVSSEEPAPEANGESPPEPPPAEPEPARPPRARRRAPQDADLG